MLNSLLSTSSNVFDCIILQSPFVRTRSKFDLIPDKGENICTLAEVEDAGLGSIDI